MEAIVFLYETIPSEDNRRVTEVEEWANYIGIGEMFPLSSQVPIFSSYSFVLKHVPNWSDYMMLIDCVNEIYNCHEHYNMLTEWY